MKHSIASLLRIDRYVSWAARRIFIFWSLNAGRPAYESRLARLPRIVGPALVVGSAPHPQRPAGVDKSWYRLSVNASQLVLELFGLPGPNLTIFQPKIKFDDENRGAYWTSLQGRGTEKLIFSVNGKNDGEIKDFIATKGYHADEIITLSEWTKNTIATDVSGRPLVSPILGERGVSNGMFAVMLALKQGASTVVMSGFSTNSGWFHNKSLNVKRNHVFMDSLACKCILERGLPVFASDPEFARATGLRLWPGDDTANGYRHPGSNGGPLDAQSSAPTN